MTLLSERGSVEHLQLAAAIGRQVGSLLNLPGFTRALAGLIRQNYHYDVVLLFVWSALDGHLVSQPTGADRHDIVDIPLAEAGLLAVGMSESYLSQIFHHELGLSPREYLTRLRVRTAKELLSSTRNSITTIVGKVGFEDPVYFSRVFHKLVGESPQGYRQRN